MELTYIVCLCLWLELTLDVRCIKPRLYIGGLFSGTRLKSYHSLVGSEMAVTDINRHHMILPDYELVLTANDTQVGENLLHKDGKERQNITRATLSYKVKTHCVHL